MWNFFFAEEKRELLFELRPKIVTLSDNGLETKINTSAQTVDNFLAEQKIALFEHDEVLPDRTSPLFPGINIKIRRAVKIKILVDGKKIENYTLTNNLLLVLAENNITLGRLDKTTPDKTSLLTNNLEIAVTRINVEEKVIPEDIAFKTTEKTDNKLGWREKKTEIAGQKGIREVKYKITYKDGKEISRVVLEKKVTKEPVTEVITQGTYVKTGNARKGQGTWYAWKGGLFAASTTIPKGSYARVTNTANGKSVMVQINDYGPQGKGRIIDLDKVAFAKIASLGAGVIGVKVEEVLN
ncbi:MAG: G5 domain-containing protein [Candidatus Moraniibacteriota bacterium]